jgi:hypothetical protein
MAQEREGEGEQAGPAAQQVNYLSLFFYLFLKPFK